MLKIARNRAKGLDYYIQMVNNASSDEEIKERLSGNIQVNYVLRAKDIVVKDETPFLFECDFVDRDTGDEYKFFIDSDDDIEDWSLKMTSPENKFVTCGMLRSRPPFTARAMQEEMFANTFLVVVSSN